MHDHAHLPNVTAYLGTLPTIGRGVYLHPSAQIIGDVVLGDDVSVWPGTVIRGDVNAIRIGAGSNVQDLSVLHVSHKSSQNPGGSPLLIGANVTIGHKVILHGCEIGDECLIGMGAIVMDKVVMQPRVLLGAGSLVPEGRVLEGGYLYLGSPAKRIRPLTQGELAHFAYSAQQYVRLKNDYLRTVLDGTGSHI
jgi:carbonic anhydrase/acetyltransferase-like protein (isoleucine patch superfamily)